MSEDVSRLVSALSQYFGFSSFRPLQQEIIQDALAGNDVLALLPTGGGKSLCFQLPALVLPGLTVVVSPLIALMKDQVDALQAAGVAATFLNSSLEAEQARSRLRGLHQNEFRLLYVAPERLMIPGFLDDLRRWNVKLFAIDEAHCISEWGHDFRPEYRQLASLRDLFPGVPMMALTATATEQVRSDILKQLKLKVTRQYVASFNRPNLTYRVIPKQSGYQQLLKFVRGRRREAGIVYCQSRKGAEGLAAKLCEDGIPAAAYHAGLEPGDRARNQERFLRDEVKVICATIAFGMGINKPNVRFVVHYDLPKNLEGYYQETGRAGRDGLPSECLLLFGLGDVIKCEHFIAQKTDPLEQERARKQLQVMAQYAENPDCRRKVLLAYFGEAFSGSPCGSCDNCLNPRESWDATLPAQKLLSCVYRIREFSGYSTGMNHVSDVLTGADHQRMKDLGHQQLSTFGIGKEHSRQEWTAMGRELIRLGYLQMSVGQFPTVELTQAGRDLLKNRTRIHLTRLPAGSALSTDESEGSRVSGTPKQRVGDIECDEILFDRLREVRKRLADERDVPAYIILSDVALRQMSRHYPSSESELIRINGIGEKKLKDFGAILLKEIAEHLEGNPRLAFGTASARPAARPASAQISTTVRESLQLFRKGESIETIAQKRQLGASTIIGHLALAVEAGETINAGSLLKPEDIPIIRTALENHGFDNVSGAFDSLKGRYTYGQIRLFQAFETARRNQAQPR
ncbi:MAG: DNA helicase RecQ [Verrucomicrobiales bacterium]|nr:DNA helicase RecQ [Verrucomicrobiales bacterium]